MPSSTSSLSVTRPYLNVHMDLSKLGRELREYGSILSLGAIVCPNGMYIVPKYETGATRERQRAMRLAAIFGRTQSLSGGRGWRWSGAARRASSSCLLPLWVPNGELGLFVTQTWVPPGTLWCCCSEGDVVLGSLGLEGQLQFSPWPLGGHTTSSGVGKKLMRRAGELHSKQWEPLLLHAKVGDSWAQSDGFNNRGAVAQNCGI